MIRCVLKISICFCISFRYSADAIITKLSHEIRITWLVIPKKLHRSTLEITSIFTLANEIDWIWRVSDFYRRKQVRYWLLWIWVCPPALHFSRAWTRPTLFHFYSDINLNKFVFPIKEKTQTIKVTFLIFRYLYW